MLETVAAQLRYTASVVFGLPFSARSLDRLVDALLATHRELGMVAPDGAELLGGPALDEETRREMQQWTQPDAWNPATPRHTYNHVVTLWFGYLWDQAVLTPDRGDPRRARITVRRRIVIPWWRYWPPRAQ